jgi:catechol 2,3-dioxygenase-like lactoylglutathione lyase family enzyme
MDEVGLDTGVYLEAYGGGRIDLGSTNPKELRRTIQGTQYWMETTVPRITNIDETFMEGGARVADVPYGGRTTSGTALVPAEREVRLGGIDHIAVRVRDVAKAEAFYREFFGMSVSYRARREGERWQHLPATFDWTESIRTGIEPEIVRLENGPLALVLVNAGAAAILHENRIGYLSVNVPLDVLNDLRGRALFRSYTIQEDGPRAFRFLDPFGVAWQLVGG